MLALGRWQGTGRVTCLALLRRRLVEKHFLAFNHPNLFVASSALHVLVQALQRKGRPLVMVEQRRLPLGAVVAVDAGGDAVLGELFAVDLLMAIFALGRCRREIRSDELGLQVRRLMAINTSRGLVRAYKGKRRLRVVEA